MTHTIKNLRHRFASAFGVRSLRVALASVFALAISHAADATNTLSISVTNSPSEAIINATSNIAAMALTNAPALALVTNLAAISTNAPASSASASSETKDVVGFDDFKLITQRNIFDPNRRAPRAPGIRPDENRKPTRIDYLNLVGAMSYEKGRFAFFDGSSSEFRRSLKPGDSIAGYKIASVNNDKVTLQKDDKKIELPIGGQLKREDEGDWRVNSTTESFASSTNSADSANSSGPKSDSSSDETNPILKRLLEARKQGK